MTEMGPAELEVVRHALSGVAEEMGIALRRAAYSPNIKERADCSAAVFGPEGEMVAQAEHIPVHLGSMPASVEAVLAAFGGRLAPGTQAVVNDPYAGGTHLPDLTMVSAVGDRHGHLLGYVANRAHHADVGGAAPGSMPATATEIVMEGLRVPPVLLSDGMGLRRDVLELIAANSRTPQERMGDLRAQLAANHVGTERMGELAARYGPAGLHRAMQAICDYSERRVRAAIRQIPDGTYGFADHLEIGPGGRTRIAVQVTVEGDRIEVDFEGTDAQLPANLNAVYAITLSCCYFVLRMLTDPEAPPNAGCYRPLTVKAPEGSVVNALPPAPVAAGNVETSQRIVDVLLGAFAQALPERVPAAGQGTMNNLLIGSGQGQAFSYYETLAGGEGAAPFRDGMSGVHTGMTNTRNTPAEAIELAYPLRVWRYELRQGSGGTGRYRGGEGLVREVEILADQATLTIQSERRSSCPWGLAGGEDGAPGRNLLIHPDGRKEQLPSKGTWPVHKGDRVRVETPGGGGWGSSPPPSGPGGSGGGRPQAEDRDLKRRPPPEEEDLGGVLMPARKWNARIYHRVSGSLEEMGRQVLERLPLRGDETVLDAGCGTGRVTALLVDRLPRGQVIAVDADAEMVRLARQNLGPTADVRLADLTELALERPVDAVFSTATFHWISNQERLYQRLFTNLLPGGRLVAQCGGVGNIARVLEAAAQASHRTPLAGYFRGWERPSRFPSPEEMHTALQRAGFTDVRCWLEPRPVVPDDPVTYLATISLGPHLERLPVGERRGFVEQVAASLPQPVTIDYVRLNIDAVRPDLPSPRPPPKGRGS